MTNFLRGIVDKIIAENSDQLAQCSLIIPNKRAAVYLQKYFADAFQKPIQSPEILTINEWIGFHTDLKIINQTELLFLLYEVHEKIEGDQKESFDDFIKWGKILLSDFDEIDRYLITPEKIFKDLRSIKEIENWSFLATDLTEGQTRYLTLWDKLIDYYKQLNALLIDRSIIYQGLAYKKFSESLNQATWVKSHYYFIGFNALSRSEEKIITHLITDKKASIYFDVDAAYIHNEEHEAGHFFRKYQHLHKNSPIKDVFNTIKKDITVIETAQQTAQTLIAGNCVQEIYEKNNDLSSTAIILADESLLIPLSKSLPAGIGKANITMGYPIKFSHLKSLVDTIFDLQFNFQKFNSSRLYHKTILKFLDHNYIRLLIADEQGIEKFEDGLMSRNRIFVDWEEFIEYFPNLASFKTLLSLWSNPLKDGFDAFNTLVQALYEALTEVKNSDVDLEIIYHFSKGYKKFEQIAAVYPRALNLKSFKKLFYQFWQEESLSFLGNPIDGLQIMGILETRALDFDNLIILGMNEGNLPQTNVINSMIPRDLKLFHDLPIEDDRQAIFAHHFYRLIQRSKTIYMTYNSSSDGMGSNEKSRFIIQLENELDKKYGHTLAQYTYSTNDKAADLNTTSYPSNAIVRAKLDEKLKFGLSPSALNKLITCPLDFYYRYILDMRENKVVEENIESSTFGTKIHEVIEKIMRDNFFDKKIQLDAAVLANEKKNIPTYLKAAYLENFTEGDLKFGQNKLSFDVSIKFINEFIEQQIKEIKASKSPIFIKDLERNISATYEWNINGEKKTIVLSGNADRIDQIGSIYRIIDYKSGKCDKSKIGIDNKILNAGEMEKFLQNPKKGYGRQLLMYALMFRQTYPEINAFSVGIVSMINIADWVQYPQFTKDKIPLITNELLDSFEEELHYLIEELYSDEFEFVHNTNADYCEHCEV